MSNDVEQRLVALNEGELRDVLSRLVYALHDENTDQCYAVLRDWGLEQDLSPELSTEELDAIDNRNLEAMAKIAKPPVRIEEAEITWIVENTGFKHIISLGVMIVWELERPTALRPFVVQNRFTRKILEEFETEDAAVGWAKENKDG